MKIPAITFIGLILSASIYGQSSVESDTLYQTQYYSFHNNLWMNLHHFFYEKASNQQHKKLKEDGLAFREIGDSLELSELSAQEKLIFDEGVKFYEKNIIDQELLHSGRIFKWLQAQPVSEIITDTSFSKDFTTVLNRLKPLYESHFWKRHQKENIDLLNNYIELIEETEREVIIKMESLSVSKWSDHVRIDLTTYGNWASAYSPAFDNIVISSIDPVIHSSIFIEFVFHESSHLLFLRKSPFRMELFQKSKELEVELPRQLWHAAMFYLSGLATKDALARQGIDHELIMKKKNVFERYYNNEMFKSILRKYYHQEIEIDKMAIDLLNLE
ncbi:MAG: hypothetical protein Salg2KO_19880 [Salibacteraceae bacterium]